MRVNWESCGRSGQSTAVDHYCPPRRPGSCVLGTVLAVFGWSWSPTAGISRRCKPTSRYRGLPPRWSALLFLLGPGIALLAAYLPVTRRKFRRWKPCGCRERRRFRSGTCMAYVARPGLCWRRLPSLLSSTAGETFPFRLLLPLRRSAWRGCVFLMPAAVDVVSGATGGLILAAAGV